MTLRLHYAQPRPKFITFHHNSSGFVTIYHSALDSVACKLLKMSPVQHNSSLSTQLQKSVEFWPPIGFGSE